MYSFKQLFLSYFFAIAPFSLLAAILTLLNITPLKANEKEYYGIEAFLQIIVITPISILVLTIHSWIFLNIGHFIHLRMLKMFGKKNEE
jgi:hypothetical protein